MMTLIGFLLIQQPDLGTGVVILFVMVAMFWVAGASIPQMLTLGLTFATLGVLLIGVAGYNSERISAFLNAESDPGGLGFQTLQLEIAFGSGGLTGLGLGESRQKFFYVPGAHTDGIFAIIGEEAGLIGALGVLLLFVLLAWRGFRIAYRARENMGQLLAVGIVAWIGIQALLNMGGISRAIPMTGIPLPLISFGGSALLSTMAALGILLSVSRYARQPSEAVLGEQAPARRPAVRRKPARRGAT
jgi:cell division protein FtsW